MTDTFVDPISFLTKRDKIPFLNWVTCEFRPAIYKKRINTIAKNKTVSIAKLSLSTPSKYNKRKISRNKSGKTFISKIKTQKKKYAHVFIDFGYRLTLS